jgi:Tfp pilus assembly protein PilF
VLNELGQTLFERSKQERGIQNLEEKKSFLMEAKRNFDLVLGFDSENMTAHYNLALIYKELGETEKSAHRCWRNNRSRRAPAAAAPERRRRRRQRAR